MPRLRKLQFDTFDQVIDDITRLRGGDYEQGGNWNLSQVCEHLGHTMRVGMHGGMKPAPWFLRAVVFRVLFEGMMLVGKMPAGATAPPELTPGERAEDDPAKIDGCLALLAESRDRQAPIPPNPFVAGMHVQKWKRLMRIHAAHHLSFLAPK